MPRSDAFCPVTLTAPLFPPRRFSFRCSLVTPCCTVYRYQNRWNTRFCAVLCCFRASTLYTQYTKPEEDNGVAAVKWVREWMRNRWDAIVSISLSPWTVSLETGLTRLVSFFPFYLIFSFVIELIEEVSITMKCKNIVRFARNEKHLLGNLYKLDCVVFRIGEWK